MEPLVSSLEGALLASQEAGVTSFRACTLLALDFTCTASIASSQRTRLLALVGEGRILLNKG